MHFYSKFIVFEKIVEAMEGLELSQKERKHLADLMDSSLRHAILDEILSNLEEEDKKVFLKMVHEEPESEKLLHFLEQKIDKVEEKIRKVSDDLVDQMHKDIKEAKKRTI